MGTQDNQAEEKKLPLGAKIIGWGWVLISLYFFSSPSNVGFAGDSMGSTLPIMIAFLMFFFVMIFAGGFLLKNDAAKDTLLGFSIFFAIFSLLFLMISNSGAIIGKLFLFLFSMISLLYLIFSKKVKEAFKK